jgi:hypothetical protein
MTKVIDDNIKNVDDKQYYLYAEYINLCNNNKIPIKYKTAENFSLQFKNYLEYQNVIDESISNTIKNGDDVNEYINLCNCNKIPIKYKTFETFSSQFKDYLDNQKMNSNYGFFKKTLYSVLKTTLSNIFTLGIIYIILIGFQV